MLIIKFIFVVIEKELVKRFCHLAPDFQGTLKLWSVDDYYNKHVRKIQLPYTQVGRKLNAGGLFCSTLSFIHSCQAEFLLLSSKV
jgi:hypothetical protein